jgi:hypothetical protein
VPSSLKVSALLWARKVSAFSPGLGKCLHLNLKVSAPTLLRAENIVLRVAYSNC